MGKEITDLLQVDLPFSYLYIFLNYIGGDAGILKRGKCLGKGANVSFFRDIFSHSHLLFLKKYQNIGD